MNTIRTARRTDPLVYLFTRSFSNGVRRSLTSPKRTISLLVFGMYYYWILMRPFMPDQPAPALSQMPVTLQLPNRYTLDGILFAVMAAASIFMLMGTLTYRGGFRPADVDVLFPTPVNPRRVLFFRILRDYLLTLILPLLFGILGYRGAKIGLQHLFANYPSHGADILRMAWLAWMLMALGWVAVGYGASLFVGRSDLQSDRNRKFGTYGIASVVTFTVFYVAVSLRHDLSLASLLSITHAVALRIVLLPATAATAIAIGGIEGDWLSMSLGIAGCLLIIAGGLAAALSQVGWLYDQAAARGFDALNTRRMRRGGNSYAIMAELARRGKLRRHWISDQISRRSCRGPSALVWKELILQSRGFFGTGVLMGIITIVIVGGGAWIGMQQPVGTSSTFVEMMLCFGAYFFSLIIGFTGFQEMLRRVDLLKPLPFSSGKTLFWELMGKTPLPAGMMTIGVIAATIIDPRLGWDSIGALALGVCLFIEISGAVLFTVVLFPDFDDPTQRGLSMIFMLISILVGSSPGLLIFFLARIALHLHSLVAAVPACAALIGVTAGLTTIAGTIYAGYNPSE